MRDFRELKVWEKAHQLTLLVYTATSTFPGEERYGLTSQVRRAASSIPANIAEGCGTSTRPDYARFLQIAMRSASELDYHLLLAKDLGMLDERDHNSLRLALAEVQRMLAALIRSLRTPAPRHSALIAND